MRDFGENLSHFAHLEAKKCRNNLITALRLLLLGPHIDLNLLGNAALC